MPPVHRGCRVAFAEAAILPEAFAHAGAAAAMHTLRNRVGDVFGFGDKRRQGLGQRVGLRTQTIGR